MYVYTFNTTLIWMNITGIEASSLTQFTSSLDSTTSYIVQINITNDSLRGEWTVVILSQGSYSIQVFGNSELSFSADLYNVDSSNAYGFSKIEGRPSQG